MEYSDQIAAVVAYVEAHLGERLDLERVARGVHYSKYHLHRMFAGTAGMTLHTYVQRRRLTEAAKQLVCSRQSILAIALAAGYESQQAFTGIFKAMYKQTPLEYRENGVFYPLQLELVLNPRPSAPEAIQRTISYAVPEDIPAWMDFVSLVVDGFPCLDSAKHLEQLKGFIGQRQALLMWDNQTVVGAAAVSAQRGSIDFFGVHPQYRRHGMERALLDGILCRAFVGRETVGITTFREGDRADTGQRAAYQRLGFVESELLTEFGYPTQRLILPLDKGGIAGG